MLCTAGFFIASCRLIDPFATFFATSCRSGFVAMFCSTLLADGAGCCGLAPCSRRSRLCSTLLCGFSCRPSLQLPFSSS